MKKIFLSIIFFFFWNTSLQAVQFTGEATEYGITMTYAELCETGSTVSNCVNPVVLGSGDSGTIDIANTTAGAAAASYGNLGTVKFGTVYTHMQVTLKRQITIAGTVSDGSNTCRTTSNNGNIAKNVAGEVSGAINTITLYMAMVGSDMGNEINSVSAGDGTGTSQSAGVVNATDEYLEWRGALSSSFTATPGVMPTMKIAFGTSSALGYIGTSGACKTGTAAADQGLYGSSADVTITIE